MKAILIYFLTLAISYVATIPPGPLSIYVAHTTLQKNIKMALWVTFGGVLCESIYAFLATEGILLFDKYPRIEFWANWLVIPILFIVGIFTFIQKNNPIQEENITLNNGSFSFLKGISLSLFNPALLPFWLVVLLEYKKHELLIVTTLVDKAFFVIGSGTGTFLLVYTYSYIANKKRNLIFKYLNDNRLNQSIGAIFLVLAIWKLVSNFLQF